MTSFFKTTMSTGLHANPDPEETVKPPKIWWSNTIFFLSVHIAAAIGFYHSPPWNTHSANLWLWFLTWQLADFGITIGYHRLYSHKAFRASFGVRLVLAVLGSCAFQGSIKWWCLRHRLHHRFTDDPEHDPYAATRGLFYSHMGWIFYKPNYARLGLIEKDDLEIDPVVRLQHKYYVPLALLSGFLLPTLCGIIWGDPFGSFIYGGLLARLFIWHCTFLVNSLAHWDGLQPYSDDDTSRGNLILALLTGGEGNHNFHHAFPHDFRSGPSRVDWDPSKWIILVLHRLGLVHSLRKARHTDTEEAKHHMQRKTSSGNSDSDGEAELWTGTVWNLAQLKSITLKEKSHCLMLLNGFVVDVTGYLKEHPGGATLLRKYSVRMDTDEDVWIKADWAFDGGLNNHSSAAKRRMRELRIARLNN